MKLFCLEKEALFSLPAQLVLFLIIFFVYFLLCGFIVKMFHHVTSMLDALTLKCFIEFDLGATVFAYSDFVFLYAVTCFQMSKHYEHRFFNNQRHYGWKGIVNLYIVIFCMVILYGS